MSGDIPFEPNAPTLPAGQIVILPIPNTVALPHTVATEGLDIGVDQSAGSTRTVTINAPAAIDAHSRHVPGLWAVGLAGITTVR